jgi:hypothetical protein
MRRCTVLLGFACLATTLPAQTDNFDSGSDAAWSKIVSATYPATYSFPADGYGGYAYRMQGAAASPSGGPGRAIAYRTDRLYTNFYVAVDIVSWDNSTTNDQVFGLLARGSGLSSGNFNAATLTTRINRFSSDGINKGQAQVYSFIFGGVGSPSSQNFSCTLLPGHRYRFVFTGVTNFYSAAIYDLQDLTYPLVSMIGDDSAGAFPASGSGGYVGIFNYSLASAGKDPTTDTTFDNFVAAELPPTSVSPPATPHGMTGFPQVVNRSPVSFANFYPAASGITFNATTLTTTNPINTSAIRLFLNGLSVSGALNISGPATNVLVSYNGLNFRMPSAATRPMLSLSILSPMPTSLPRPPSASNARTSTTWTARTTASSSPIHCLPASQRTWTTTSTTSTLPSAIMGCPG